MAKRNPIGGIVLIMLGAILAVFSSGAGSHLMIAGKKKLEDE